MIGSVVLKLWQYIIKQIQIITSSTGIAYSRDMEMSGTLYHICFKSYRKTSNISRTLVGNKIVDNSDVVGASPVGAAPTTSSFST